MREEGRARKERQVSFKRKPPAQRALVHFRRSAIFFERRRWRERERDVERVREGEVRMD